MRGDPREPPRQCCYAAFFFLAFAGFGSGAEPNAIPSGNQFWSRLTMSGVRAASGLANALSSSLTRADFFDFLLWLDQLSPKIPAPIWSSCSVGMRLR